jgi:hypothetical protein
MAGRRRLRPMVDHPHRMQTNENAAAIIVDTENHRRHIINWHRWSNGGAMAMVLEQELRPPPPWSINERMNEWMKWRMMETTLKHVECSMIDKTAHRYENNERFYRVKIRRDSETDNQRYRKTPNNVSPSRRSLSLNKREGKQSTLSEESIILASDFNIEFVPFPHRWNIKIDTHTRFDGNT